MAVFALTAQVGKKEEIVESQTEWEEHNTAANSVIWAVSKV
jgi:hypothetical protein